MSLTGQDHFILESMLWILSTFSVCPEHGSILATFEEIPTLRVGPLRGTAQKTQMPVSSQHKALLIRPLEGRLHFGETQEGDAGGVPSRLLKSSSFPWPAHVGDVFHP